MSDNQCTGCGTSVTVCCAGFLDGDVHGCCPSCIHPVSSDDLIHDRATIRAGWDDDDPEVTRIARRVGAALNSGRDKAVVDVVLDEVQTLRAEAETLRAVVNMLKTKRESYQRLLDVAIDEENLRWLPAILGALDSILEAKP